MTTVDDRGLRTPRLHLCFTIGKRGFPRDNESLIRDLYFGGIDAALEKERNITSVPALSDISQEPILYSAHDRLLNSLGVQKARKNGRGVKSVSDRTGAPFLKGGRPIPH